MKKGFPKKEEVMFPSVKFHLNEFKAVGRWVEKNLPPFLAWLVNGQLKALEGLWIDAKVSSAVEQGLAAYRASEAPPTSFIDSTQTIKKALRCGRAR